MLIFPPFFITTKKKKRKAPLAFWHLTLLWMSCQLIVQVFLNYNWVLTHKQWSIWEHHGVQLKGETLLNDSLLHGQQFEDLHALNIILHLQKKKNFRLIKAFKWLLSIEFFNNKRLFSPAGTLHFSQISAQRYCFCFRNKLWTPLRP